MTVYTIDLVRGQLVESTHRVSVAVVDPSGRLVAAAGNPDLVTYWRSAAKPFQAMPLLQDGGADRFGLTDDEIALACASHSSEEVHLAVAERFMAKVGITERDLACGPHTPLSAEVAAMVIRRGLTPTPKWSNCSGKHTGLIGQAKHAGWPLAGYEKEGHPVQQRVQAEVERWTGLASDQLTLAIDGCATVCFGLPLRAMAVAYARFATWSDPAAKRIWRAMTAHPELVAGTGRLCTELMRSWPGEIVAKVGAEGVYCAAVPSRGWGIGLKVEDGTWESANLALLEVLRSLLTKDGGLSEPLGRIGNLIRSTNPPVKNTRGAEVGETRISGELEFFAD